MLFSSWQFIFVFLPVVLLGFMALPSKPGWPRKVWLLASSLFFYGYWKVEYVPLLLVSIGFNYAFAELIMRAGNRRLAKTAVVLGVSFNLLLLAYFKYTNFLLGCLSLPNHEPLRLNIILPLAISFYTFTQVGYLVDVYRDRTLHHGFLDYAVFVVLFPHLIAGPIVRHWEVIPQYAKRELRPRLVDVQLGLALFLIGLCKKVLLADSVSGFTRDVYGAADKGIEYMTWFGCWMGTLAFAMQIYFDFSGYSDMAIGLARLFGVRFPINFNSPYQATSIAEFWMRWHITLTRFLREYLYFTLGGNRCTPTRHMMNLMATMLLSGLWHGAGWTFVIWGGLHGAYLVIAHQWGRLRKRLGWEFKYWWYRFAAAALTFVAVLFGWVFFKAANLSVALRVLSVMSGHHGFTMSDDVTHLGRSAGRFWHSLGIQFVNKTFEADYSSVLIMTGLMLAIAIALPNSQRLLSKYEPALETVERPKRFRLVLGLKTGALLGMGLFLVVRTFYTGAPSPFLYFNF